MAMKKFTDFLNRFLYEEGSTPAEEMPKLTQEEMSTFETSMSEEGGENISEMAQRIIIESQVKSDNDEYPDICNVQSVLDTAGVDVDHELVRKILENFAHCDPEELEKDGISRRQAIMDAIEQTKKQAENLKVQKANEEHDLTQAEKEAEAVCTEAISQANIQSEREIEEEKARSAAIIAEIRQRTDSATEAAKQQRDTTLKNIAAQRAENESALHKSANLVAETEKQGQMVINQIDTWLGYLK